VTALLIGGENDGRRVTVNRLFEGVSERDMAKALHRQFGTKIRTEGYHRLMEVSDSLEIWHHSDMKRETALENLAARYPQPILR
jgi:hypothetical protein